MSLGPLPAAPRIDGPRKRRASRARSVAKGVVGTILCSVACSCGGGGGDNGLPQGYIGPSSPPLNTAPLLAVTNAASGTIDLLTIDTATGVPTPIAGDPLPDGPAASAVAIYTGGSVVSTGPFFLYVSSTSGEVRGYLIYASPLSLSPTNESPYAAGGPSAAIAVDPTGEFVLTANGSANTLSVFKIQLASPCGGCAFPFGSLQQGVSFAAADPISFVVTSQYIYAVNAVGRSVSVYGFDTNNDQNYGTISSVQGSPSPIAGTPNGMVIDPTGLYIYVTESQPNEISAFSVNPSDGSLTPIAGSPFPASYPIQSPVMVADGKRLCAADGTDVDCFLVDSSTGALTESGLSYTNGRALALALDAPDNFVYVLDNVNNQVEVFSVNPTDGSLTLIPGSPFALFPGAGSQNLGPSAIAVAH